MGGAETPGRARLRATPLGWGVCVTVAVLLLGARVLRYAELAVLGGAGAAAMGLAAATAVRRPRVSVTVRVSPRRVIRSEPATLTVTVRNMSRWPSPPFTLHLPHGPVVARPDPPGPGAPRAGRLLAASDLVETWWDRRASTVTARGGGGRVHTLPAAHRGAPRTGGGPDDRPTRAADVLHGSGSTPSRGAGTDGRAAAAGAPDTYPPTGTDTPAAAVSVPVPRLAGSGCRTIELAMDTRRRGVVRLGPAEVIRSDPFGLTLRRQRLPAADTLHVRPRTRPLAPLASAPSRDPDGQTGQGTAGGLEIHTLRRYTPGEDLRLVHWPSSARAGELMVRTHVDPSEPAATVVLDNRPAAYPPGRVGVATFEEAVDVAAAAVMTCAQEAFGVRLVTTAGLRVAGRRRRRDADALMDELAGVHLDDNASLDVVATLRRGGLGTLVLVTGGFDRQALAALAPVAHAYGRVVLVRVGPRSPAAARAIDRRDSSDRARLRTASSGRVVGIGVLGSTVPTGGTHLDGTATRAAGRLTVIDVADAEALGEYWPTGERHWRWPRGSPRTARP
ncbi:MULTISPECIES: DUF58 domain-containing protein [Frankia]|uniref:DUF58 domain-containing protein n=1 Tax=Frankia alni (strain DSM 45986 / CECT 9034 / ACN14a) TaxID=326424 RepID=Q0RBW9_FRAAA|nr:MULTISPECIES: DUF58 domain-containing protein [Frankia]CAJ65061.1 hypothetical protein FRAAL6438 [Frankia alni ACN14a]